MSQLEVSPSVADSSSATTTLLPSSPPSWEGVVWWKKAWWRSTGVVYRHRDLLMVVGLMLVAVGLRLWINRGLWLDEATSVSQTRMSFPRMLSYLRTSDAHPPLFHMLLWSDIRLFGYSPLAIRLPSIALGTLLVPFIYGLGREMFNRKTGLLAALIIAIGPSAIWYSQEARMYALFMVLATIALWAQLRCVRSGSTKAWIVYTVASAAMIYAHYFSTFYVFTQQLGFLAAIWLWRGTDQGRKLFAGWWRSVFGILLLLAPLGVITYGQLDRQAGVAVAEQANGSAAGNSRLYTVFSSLAASVFGYHSERTMTAINALWPLAMLGALLALGRGRSRSTALLVALIFIPLTVLFVLSFKRVDVLELRYFAGAIPAVTLLLARGITLLAKRKLPTALVTVGLTVLLSVGLVDAQLSGANPRVYDFQSVLADINEQQQPGDEMYFEPFYLHPSIKYYAPRFESYPLIAGLSSTTTQNRIFIVDSLEFSDKALSEDRVRQVTERLLVDRKLVQHIERNHIEVWIFE